MAIRQIIAGNSDVAPQGAYELAPDVVLALLDDGSARLLDFTGSFHAVTPTGAVMLDAALRRAENDAVKHVRAHFDVSAAVVRRDMDSFLATLQRQGLVGRRGTTRAARNGRMAALFLWPLLTATDLLPPLSTLKANLLLALAHQSVRRFGWASTVAAWRRWLERHGAAASEHDDERALAADNAIRTAAARHYFHVECKERALACWLILRAQGVPARLVVGVDLFPFASHCWCEVGTRVLTDFADRCERFTSIMVYE